ncbi:MAG: hypothetical protein KKC42_04220, partial [Candidatus Omnitrophica bacterium]|nr:hypothetical protein [Candidatus Omnitrophota bacterium]
MNAINLLKGLFSSEDKQRIEAIKDSGLSESLEKLAKFTSDAEELTVYINGKPVRVKEQRYSIDYSGSYILREVITTEGRRFIGIYRTTTEDGRHYIGFSPYDREAVNRVHEVIYEERTTNTATWIEISSLPTDILKGGVYEQNKEQDLRLNFSGFIPLADISGKVRIDYSTIFDSTVFGGQDIKEQRIGIELQREKGDYRLRAGAAMYINGEDRSTFYVGMDEKDTNIILGLDLQGGNTSVFAGYRKLFDIAGNPGRITINYLDKNISVRLIQRYGPYQIEGILESGSEEADLILGAGVLRDVARGWQAGGGIEYSNEAGVAPFLVVLKRGVLSDLFALRVKSEDGGLVADLKAQKIFANRLRLYGDLNIDNSDFDASVGAEYLTKDNSLYGLRFNLNSQNDIEALLHYISSTMDIELRASQDEVGVRGQYFLFGDHLSRMQRSFIEARYGARNGDFQPQGNILIESKYIESKYSKRYAEVIKEWQDVRGRASLESSGYADELTKGLIRGLDESSSGYFMGVMRTSQRFDGETGRGYFIEIFKDFRTLKEKTELAEYLGREINLMDDLVFSELLYWREKLINERLEPVQSQIHRFNRLKDEVAGLLPGGRFNPENIEHVMRLRDFAYQDGGMGIGEIEKSLRKAAQIRDYLVNTKGAGIPGQLPLIDRLDITKDAEFDFLLGWAEKSIQWERQGLKPERMIGYVAAILEEQGIGRTIQARAPPESSQDSSEIARIIRLAKRFYAMPDAEAHDIRIFSYVYNTVLNDTSLLPATLTKDLNLRFYLAYYLSDNYAIDPEGIKTAYDEVVAQGIKFESEADKGLLAHLISLQYEHGDVAANAEKIIKMKDFF